MPRQAGFGEALRPGKAHFHIPYIVMTAAQVEAFRLRHDNPASSQRMADWLRMCLEAGRDGKCDGVVTYCLDKGAGSEFFPLRPSCSTTIGLPESDNRTGLLLHFIYRLLSDIASTVCHGLGGRDRKRRYNFLIGGWLRQKKIFRTEKLVWKNPPTLLW